MLGRLFVSREEPTIIFCLPSNSFKMGSIDLCVSAQISGFLTNQRQVASLKIAAVHLAAASTSPLNSTSLERTNWTGFLDHTETMFDNAGFPINVYNGEKNVQQVTEYGCSCVHPRRPNPDHKTKLPNRCISICRLKEHITCKPFNHDKRNEHRNIEK